MNESQVIEGCGPVDLFLAKQRYKLAHKKIKSVTERNRILDIGCGGYPLFLISTNFTEKYGLDQNIVTDGEAKVVENNITIKNYNIDNENFPFEDNFFDVVCMLAVFEHIEPDKLVDVHKDVYRILKPNGMYVMTTPTFWTAGLLSFLAKMHIISDAPIKEHKGSYKYSDVASVLEKSSFEKEKMRHGYFELYMNMWVTARK